VPGDGATALVYPLLLLLPLLLPSLLAGAVGIGRETQAAAEQGAAAGMDFKRGGRLGFDVQADGGDLRHPCPEARGAHPGGCGRARCGSAPVAIAGARVRQPREEERLQGRRLTRGTHLAVKGGQWG
jgi:hypothetical protein